MAQYPKLCYKSVLLAKGNVGVSARGETIKSLSNHHHHHFLTKCLMKDYDYHHPHYSHDDQNTLIVVEVSHHVDDVDGEDDFFY